MPLHLYNTLTRTTELFLPVDPGRVTFYTCGPTVYDDAHIGNFRAFLAADLLRRWIESPLCELENDARSDEERAKGRRVVHVMNITDVGHMTDDSNADGGGEDKMAAAARRLVGAVQGAKKSGTAHAAADVDAGDPYSIADFYTARFVEDARKLGLRVALEAEADPSLLPRATQNVPGMIAMIERLVERGFAYQAGEAVYFDVQKFAGYGSLSGNSIDELRGGAGGRVDAEHQAAKRHPADFLLWKADASHLMKWDSPWGAGYPGWHIECSVMSLDRLVVGGLERVLAASKDDIGDGFEIDLHSGGEDNIFPHHECERAQSCACTGGERFARHWFHARFLLVEGEKMSKSKGNFFTARDLFAKGHEAAAVRLELVKTHYRANANFTEQGLKDSARMVERWRRVVVAGESSGEGGARPGGMLDEFAGAMHDDLNIAGALGVLNGWVGSLDAPTRADGAVMREVDSVLGVLDLVQAATTRTEIGVFTGVEPSAEVEGLLLERREAKRAKDFVRSDAIRDELAGMGLAIKDVAGGKVEVSRG